MDAERIFQFMIDELNNFEKSEVCGLLAGFLSDNDYFVAEDEDELEELALDNTDLVRPE